MARTTCSIFFIVHSQAQLRTCPGRSETFNCRARSNNMTICSNSFGDFFQYDLDRTGGTSVQRTPLYILLNRRGYFRSHRELEHRERCERRGKTCL
ncbi:hypothetical protein BKA58DRAFT_382555 [Alternaria rosae]|uniref:uncharacterized protein n=1 Tax=Alternaria rosae TaxID=1187941 RepID=UPI001E8CBDFF|nr:uncharacterized protein BKA58DRAFT_382555 [Alternaria rosae]KAH6872685.1 hypothetical protein BKA58DRAFT_382555 [Alternaria rosae]